MAHRSTILSTLVVVALLAGAGSLCAQAGAVAPSGQFGVGAGVGAGATQGFITLQYAVNPGLIIGTNLSVSSLSNGDTSFTGYSVGAFGRFLFEGPINPFLQVGVGIGQDRETGLKRTDILALAGLQYFATRNIGLNVQVGLFDYIILEEPLKSQTAFGMGFGSVAAEWYFNR